GGQILISLLIPFAAYLAAEAVHASGILAAVAAGVTMSFTERQGSAMAATRIRRAVVWDTVKFVANGVVFVILDPQLPSIIACDAEAMQSSPHKGLSWVALFVFAIVAALATLRFVRVWTSLQQPPFRTRGKQAPPKVGLRLVAVMSLAGAR